MRKLTKALEQGNLKQVRKLVEAGVDPNDHAQSSEFPVEIAARTLVTCSSAEPLQRWTEIFHVLLEVPFCLFL
jgi:hypothetical protein